MTAAEFRAALAALGLSVRRAATVLGIGLRTAYAYARGERPIPHTVAKLLRASLALNDLLQPEPPASSRRRSPQT
jgi:transcriptional regulator with XRE-family HTH domain